jgi:[glutamine synthetase] adenylyltransferase / [glutamine synthetase]-adenylyl-L-tyrosine phosphorylase
LLRQARLPKKPNTNKKISNDKANIALFPPRPRLLNLTHTQQQAQKRAQELVPAASAELIACVLISDFAFDVLKTNAQWLDDLGTPPEHPTASDASSLSEYRVRRSIAQIALECSGKLSVEASLAYASDTAKRCIEAALAQAERETEARFGVARDSDGQAVRLCIFAMGKLGGHELNFSSDVDLIMCYASAGESDGQRALDNAEYFARITRRTAQLLTERSALGSAYRVDLRLRPFGSAGQAALSFAAMEDYYQREGRDWERYAWIKARPIAGDIAGGERLRELLRPFIYRRYLDFAAFEGMREMKSLVDAEVRKSDMGDNLKLGPGGIREIEFLIQLEQLIRGGRDQKLRVSGSLPALAALQEARWLTAEDAAQLRADYLFLRSVENRVQMLGDQQTHFLPAPQAQRDRIAASLKFASTADFLDELAKVRTRVHRRFGEAITLPTLEGVRQISAQPAASAEKSLAPQSDAPEAEDPHQQAALMWQSLTGPNRDQIGEADKPSEIGLELWHALLGFADSTAVQNASARGRSRIDRVVPMLWTLALKLPPDSIEPCALRLIEFLQAIAGRSAYLALLAEKPAVSQRLVQLFAESAWLARLITSTPMLLDELLDVRRLNLPNDAASLALEADAELVGDDSDLEHAFELLIAYKHSVQLRVAVAFLQSRIDGLEAVAGLSELADVLIARVLAIAWRELARSHGQPLLCRQAGDGFAVLGYGSLGGRELNFASDLDLVFVYDEHLANCETDGQKTLDGQRFYVRLAQRVISLLTTATRFGALYAIDTRLRPNGNKGLLVTSLDAYGDYQQREAWLWEHQALVRARWVAGDPAMASQFAQLRSRTLAQARDANQVQASVSSMREKMRAELDRSTGSLFDLKQGDDGLVDLEFFMQAKVLSAGVAKHWPTESKVLLPMLGSTQSARHKMLLELGLRATLALRPRLVARG